MPDDKTVPPTPVRPNAPATETDAAGRTQADSPAGRALRPSRTPPARDDLDDTETSGARYEMRDRIGEGGMGEVYLCADHRVGRDIAMKVIRPARSGSEDARRRFIREARVQGQLEHPSVVPVYDLGKDANGSAYFTMRRVRGKTLEQLIDELYDGHAATHKEWTRHKLLTAFSSVCLAVDFAHARGILHRDIKPDNVMLGDFGEVYVLDWGLAKMVASEGDEPESKRTVTPDPIAGDAPRTAFGTVMGTPGYMSPEQATRGEVSIDARADVYALGSILYEILALEPLHPRGTSDETMESTLRGADARFSVRAPWRDVPPELEAICVRATALRREDRFATAREVYEAVEGFLAGDLDVARRRTLAVAHAQAAAEATDRALAGGPNALAERSAAMREVSRAVALDPANTEAMHALVRLFTETPKELPREATEDLSRALLESQRAAARAAAVGYVSWLAYAPLVLWMGIHDFKWGALCDVLFAFAAAASWYVGRSRDAHTARAADAALLISTLAIVASTGVAGPFMLLPGLAAVNTILYVASADRSRRLWAIGAGCLAVAVPFAIEIAGVVPRSISFHDGSLVTHPQIASFTPLPTLVFLFLTQLAVVITASIFVARFRDVLHESQERLHFQAWQLRQFVPKEAYGAAARGTIPPRA